MKNKHTAQLRHHVASTRRSWVSVLLNLRTRICLALFCSVSMSAYADIITVTNTNDSGSGSLRQALADANDGDTIDFDPSLKGQTISLTSAELVINKSITISGFGPNLLAVSRAQNAPAFRIFNLMPGRSVTIQSLTISNGLAPEFGCGGGILDEGSLLSLINCTVSGNSTDGTGGGICADANATLMIDSSTLNGNYAGDYGGSIANSGTLTINNSTLSGNRGEFTGGAILNGFNSGASLTVSNRTLSGNTTQLHGGGIFNEGQSAISNSTLSGNSGMTAGAIFNRLATLDIDSTILNRGELGPNILNDSGTVTSHGYNLSSDDGGGLLNGPGDQINTNPLLGPLQNNGGPTFTHQLLPGSPAIDAGDPNFTPPPIYDQRGPGFFRVVNSRIDKGSFEVQGPTPTPTPTATPCASGGAWTEQSPYPIAVSGNAVASQGGNVYSFGGIANNTAIVNAYKYTPANNTWTPIASLPAPRGWFSAASDGTYIYLLGGVDQNFSTTAMLWRYDPVSNNYNTSLPSYTIPTYFHASVYLNGKIYRIAGRAVGTDFHVEVYDIATNTWSMAANYPFANHSLMAAALGNYIYAGGGNASPDKTYRYDPSTDTWDDAAIADLPAGRSAAASEAYNGRWLLAGGDVNFAISNSAIAWDPATNTWSNLPNMIQARDYLGGATAGQSFYAVAGNSAPGTPTNDNQQYSEIPCPTPTPIATASPTPTVTPTATPTTTATATPTPTATGCSVTTSQPPCGSIVVGSAPTDFTDR